MLSKAALRCLGEMIEAETDERYEDAELVCDGNSCWLGIRRVQKKTVNELLSVLALKDSNDGSTVQRYVINGVGRALHADPNLALDVVEALKQGGSFTIVDGKVQTLGVLLTGADNSSD